MTFPRAVFLSATGSGKTLVIYLLARAWEHLGKVLIIVPTTTLVHQGIGDFKKYGCDIPVQGIVGGETREVSCPITFSTWQSIMKEPKEWMQQFSTVVVDEAHGAKSDSLQKILSAAKNAHVRFGFTGTLSGAKTHEMILTGLLGPVVKVTSAKALMQAGTLARATIKMIIMEHPKHARKFCPKVYQDEILFLINCDQRNTFISNLALALKGNTLVLYTRVGQHGKRLYERIKPLAGSRGVHFLHGGVDGADRNEVRRIVEEAENDVVIASFGVFSQGIDVSRLHNIIFSSPYKSKIIVPQSIGRGLRLAQDKRECKIYDVVDDLSFGRRRNYAMKHSEARLKIYAEQDFDVSSVRVNLNYESINTQADAGGT
jgi:superfamily II DNA or RNA helicase